MYNNVLEYLEYTVKKMPEKVAFSDEKNKLTFFELYNAAKNIGTYLYKKGHYKEPVVVFMEKSSYEICAFLGAVYGGCYYVPVHKDMSEYRIMLILQKINGKAVICDKYTKDFLKNIYNGNIYEFEEIIKYKGEEEVLDIIRRKHIDTDPLYMVFTSGTTGGQKGVVVSHKSVIDYIEQLTDTLGFNENTVFANQSPFYLDACLKEIYSTIMCGGTTYIMPEGIFRFPVKVVEYLNHNKINTICWCSSALSIVSGSGILWDLSPKYLKTVAFGGEILPVKELNKWKNAIPECNFYNLYGPTEATGMSCYYKVQREFSDDETIPIGRPFKNTQIILLDENNQIAEQGNPGEICIRGTCLALGYYGENNKTNDAFVINPLNDIYPEIIYRTGDMGKYNDKGELVFVCRKDNRIKRMGYRIQLEDIEEAADKIAGVTGRCCIYDNNRLVLCYSGNIEEHQLITTLKKLLPVYMIPDRIVNIKKIPLMPGGKTDRKKIIEIIKNI